MLTMDSVPGVADCRERLADWPPAGPDWRARVATARITGLAGATIETGDPEAVARLWATLVESAARRDEDAGDAENAWIVPLDNAAIRFRPVAGARGPGIVAVALKAADPAAILAAARARGLDSGENRVTAVGTPFELVPAA